MGVAGGGVDDVEQAFAQDAQGFGVVGLGLGEQELLTRDHYGRVDVVGQRLDRGDDDPGLVGEHVTSGEGGADGLVVGVESGGELDLAVRLGLGLVGLACPPDGGGGGAGGVAEAGGVGVGGDAELELGEAGGEAGELDQGRAVSVSVMDQVGWSVSWSRRAWMSAAATVIGWPDAVVVVRLLMGLLKHWAPTVGPRIRGCPQRSEVTGW